VTDRKQLPYEDPLVYLPGKGAQVFEKRTTIYDAQRPATDLYVVVLGRVKVITTDDDGGQIVGRIVRAEGLFGESSLIGPSPTSESAVALEKTTLMSWNRNELERLVEREPRLGLALLQSFARQGLELQTGIRRHVA
jgi:CRP-like cAMP-binding protein